MDSEAKKKKNMVKQEENMVATVSDCDGGER